jgi:hypothetical protein
VLVDYFGIEIDNEADYMDAEMKSVSDNTSYFNFYFDTEDDIEYRSLSKIEVGELISRLFKKSLQIEVRTDNKDVTIYF